MFEPKRAAAGVLLAVVAGCPHLIASSPAGTEQLSRQLDAIYNKHEFGTRNPQMAWLGNGDSYTVVEPAADGKGTEIAAYGTASGKRSALVSVADLTPPGAKEPLDLTDYAWSADARKLLIFTNAKRVWRQNTRGDYWVLEMAAASPETRLTKLGGDAPESSLMFATFSPDSSLVACVRANNLYVEELATKKILQLTADGSPDIINGTSDWVNEEELSLRDCFRWSADGQLIAFWQFDQSGVSEYTLINDTDAEYPSVKQYKYPQAGTTNSAVRAGVVAVSGGATTWIKLSGERPYIDLSRMAMWGHSGGGSTTLNVMFRYPGVYSTGIAVASVPDQAHYDTIYQERYMGLPQDNKQGYHDGSPINFASGLAGNLLIVHGSGDDNVHFQGAELLVNKLIELGKPFDFMDYPNRTHGLYEGKGTSFHVFSLVARYLEEHVPPGGVAR